MSGALALVSGGLDSVTLAYHLRDQGYTVHALSVNYGQRHQRELDAALTACGPVVERHDVLDLQGLGALLVGSALTDPSVSVPEGHYEAETMRATVVPNRNMILLSLALGVAMARGVPTIAIAAHAGDRAIYPDCRPEFIRAFERTARYANDWGGLDRLDLLAPFVHWDKAGIARHAKRLGVPIEQTYSCYKGGPVHCSRCGTCIERREALEAAGIEDPTEYADSRPWRTILEEINGRQV